MSDLTIFMPTGKVAKRQLEGQLKEMYLSGDFDPLEIEVKIKGVADAVDAVRKDKEVRDAVMDAISMYNEKTIELPGAQIQRKNTPAKYDFKACGDPKWEELEAKIKALKEQQKERENFLKALSGKTTIVDFNTGEVYEVVPPPKTQGETIAIKFI